jgi:hypothetical protein
LRPREVRAVRLECVDLVESGTFDLLVLTHERRRQPSLRHADMASASSRGHRKESASSRTTQPQLGARNAAVTRLTQWLRSGGSV